MLGTLTFKVGDKVHIDYRRLFPNSRHQEEDGQIIELILAGTSLTEQQVSEYLGINPVHPRWDSAFHKFKYDRFVIEVSRMGKPFYHIIPTYVAPDMLTCIPDLKPNFRHTDKALAVRTMLRVTGEPFNRTCCPRDRRVIGYMIRHGENGKRYHITFTYPQSNHDYDAVIERLDDAGSTTKHWTECLRIHGAYLSGIPEEDLELMLHMLAHMIANLF